MTQKLLVRVFALVVSIALLHGCGGGGGGGDTGNNNPPANNSNWDSMVWDQSNWS